MPFFKNEHVKRTSYLLRNKIKRPIPVLTLNAMLLIRGKKTYVQQLGTNFILTTGPVIRLFKRPYTQVSNDLLSNLSSTSNLRKYWLPILRSDYFHQIRSTTIDIRDLSSQNRWAEQLVTGKLECATAAADTDTLDSHNVQKAAGQMIKSLIYQLFFMVRM